MHVETPRDRPTVLVLLDSVTTTARPECIRRFESDGALVRVIDYRNLMGHLQGLRQIVRDRNVDMLLFSRNDQVFDRVSIGPLIRELRVGYSSFSGIDPAHALEQTLACLDDYLAKGTTLAADPGVASDQHASGGAGTFSLLFDLEQLGGARFGLPRILRLLEKHGALATFFTTNFVTQTYTNILDVIARSGHEVGLHGEYHEYLSSRLVTEQTVRLRRMKLEFESHTPVFGANFLSRMDASTIEAMIANRLAYFVAFMEHRYRPFAYRRMPVHPYRLWSPGGSIWMMPISVETNNCPWFSVRNSLDSAVNAGHSGWPHVNVLLHPFRDGSMSHIRDLERILDYMTTENGYRGVRLCDVARGKPRQEPDAFIYYRVPGTKRATVIRTAGDFWHNEARYEQRVSSLYTALKQAGHIPALCLGVPDQRPTFAVYPYVPAGVPLREIHDDPLSFPSGTSSARLMVPKHQRSAVHAFVPDGAANSFVSSLRELRPRFHRDYRGFVPELALRIAYRLTAGTHRF
jgi:peptidoglycan/xylan/chitin deacetylase (PgdA/CDA1 family)